MQRIVIVVALWVLPLLAACEQSTTEAQQIVRPVVTSVVKSVDHGRQWTFAGTAEDALETALSFRVSGEIVKFPGEQIGRQFAQGEIIARLDPSDYELELRGAKANLEQVRAKYTRAKADLKRKLELFNRSVISRGELDQVEAEYKSFEAQLAASSKKIDILRKRLSYTTLKAPFDGWIGKVSTHVHQNVRAGQSVVSFNAGRQMKMYIAVPDVLISEVAEGDAVDVSFDALPGKIMKGKVMEVSVDSSTSSTYPVKVYLDNENKMVRSGMSGHVTFSGKATATPQFYVPAVAVMSKTDGTRLVWIVDPKTATVKPHPVVVGKLSPLGLEIVAGVDAGDIVVIRGVHHLKEGLKVRFVQTEVEK